MKLLGLVSCVFSASTMVHDEAAGAGGLQLSSSPEEDDRRRQATAADVSVKRRRRDLKGRSRSLGDWKPSLGDIYEDGEVRKVGAAAGGAAASRKSGRSASRVLPRAHSDDLRHMETSESNVAGYAPTAFLF